MVKVLKFSYEQFSSELNLLSLSLLKYNKLKKLQFKRAYKRNLPNLPSRKVNCKSCYIDCRRELRSIKPEGFEGVNWINVKSPFFMPQFVSFDETLIIISQND